MRTIVLADKQIFVRSCVKAVCESTKQYEVIAEIGDPIRLAGFLKHTIPDLIIINISVPNAFNDNFIKQIKSSFPFLRIVVLTDKLCNSVLERLKDIPVNGIFDKKFNDIYFHKFLKEIGISASGEVLVQV